MKLGIDFGTTRVVVAAVDRGNYPVVTFETPDGGTADWFPALAAVRGDERLYGWDAYAAQADSSWTVLRSLKRLLDDAGPNTQLNIAGQQIALMDMLRDLLLALRQQLLEHSNIPDVKSPLEAMIGVPANANTNQRFLTAEGFRKAGFEVLGMLNEPSAASIEFGHRNKAQLAGQNLLLVYDLGGGTFDASLVQLDEKTHTIVASDGISTLGGDDFDQLLAELALDGAGISLHELTQAETFRLLEECRLKKEALHPNSRKIVVDMSNVREDLPEVSVQAAQFYERARVLVEETIHVMHDLLEKNGSPAMESLYLTGGGSDLPLVARVVKEEFGRKVKRSAYTRSATAIGLAIQADASAGYVLRDSFTRYFGVWREADGGHRIIFDALFPKGTPLPGPGEPPLEIRRSYEPVHNVGHFRYLECSYVTDDGQPHGDITLWDEILFPFNPELKDRSDLSAVLVEHSPGIAGQVVEECYRCDGGGAVTVAIRNLTSGYERSYPLGRWSVSAPAPGPAKKRKGATRKQTA